MARDMQDILQRVYDEVAEALKTTATIDASDIQIGAVEIKDGTTDNRAEVKAANAASAVGDMVTKVQLIANDGTKTQPVASTPTGTAAAAPSNATTTANVASAVVKASAGTLYGLSGYNARTSEQFILFFDSATVPADTAQAVLVVKVPASSNFAVDFGAYGRRFSTGIAWSNSSTQPLKTIGSADCHVDAQYV